ncbi:hypothetical protein FRC07_008429 [Ceratobasidium sp. 392]|nr:hypothetical protein FRC07_008429 [Ceratobasidium sp. 392]
MRFALASFVAVATAALAFAQPHTRQLKSINPDIVPAPVDWANLPPAAPVEAGTNAKRFAKGLPPLAPRTRRRHPQRGAPHRLGTRVQAAPRAQTSPTPPENQKCNILVKTGDATLGYITPSFNTFGEYGTFQPGPAGALEISFSYSPDSPSQLDFLATNGPSSTYPYMGAVMGYASDSDNFSQGSYNYAYVAGTQQTPSGSPPVVGDSSFGTATGIPGDYESAIWTYDPATQAISAQWINTDGSAPGTHLLYANDGNDAILLTGDPATLNETFGTDYPEVTFACVPVAGAQPQ